MGEIVSLQTQTSPYFQLREKFKCTEHIGKGKTQLKTSPKIRKSEENLPISDSWLEPCVDFNSFYKIFYLAFSHTKALGSNVDLAVKKVKINPVPSFEQTLQGQSPQCCIPSSKLIGLLVLEKIFKGLYHIWAWWPTWSYD